MRLQRLTGRGSRRSLLGRSGPDRSNHLGYQIVFPGQIVLAVIIPGRNDPNPSGGERSAVVDQHAGVHGSMHRRCDQDRRLPTLHSTQSRRKCRTQHGVRDSMSHLPDGVVTRGRHQINIERRRIRQVLGISSQPGNHGPGRGPLKRFLTHVPKRLATAERLNAPPPPTKRTGKIRGGEGRDASTHHQCNPTSTELLAIKRDIVVTQGTGRRWCVLPVMHATSLASTGPIATDPWANPKRIR